MPPSTRRVGKSHIVSHKADQPGKDGLTRWKTFLVKFWLHGYHFVQTATTWLECVIRV
ncbi:hypothetical protein FocTR4_00001211 [Fusarium oxysporum f. sp. cubense]|uniref:Uncharacterized protein n=1 Tax=Fusarium oxysporum f. sp. cubense TaxID=61366 RepID=A0A5C6T3C8_FUSOC|nr:hypothetical protein FocTR4_00001211 [Fusarium oxysporum f. sp. cubense]